MESMIHHILPILRKAGKGIMDIYSDENKFLTQAKDDLSPLTAADQLSNDIIVEELAALYPDVPVISEESKQISYRDRSGYTNYFLVDPLDGTKEFIKRNGEFTINIAFMAGALPMGGFIYVPVTGMTYYAEHGRGAFKIDPEDVSTELKSTPFYLLEKGIKVIASRSHRDEKTEKIITSLNAPKIVTCGSSLKFLMIADGDAHFYPRRAPTMEWDTAAGQCILTEAGGSVLNFETLSPLIYNKENLLNPHFIAMGALLDPETLKHILIS